MIALTHISDAFAITGPLTGDQLHAAAARGFGTVINFRPDGEASDQIDSAEVAKLAEKAGLRYFFVPATKYEIFENHMIEATIEALSRAEGPVLATCATGQRAAILWGAIRARSAPVDEVLDIFTRAGLDFDCLRDEFEEQAALGAEGAQTFDFSKAAAREREAA